jgi:tetratricopeptide (TPR) repeat protein
MIYVVALFLGLLRSAPTDRPPLSRVKPPTDSLARRNNAAVRLARQGHFVEAERLLQPGGSLPDSDTLRYNLALVKGQQADYAGAVTLLGQTMRFPNAQFNRGVFLCRDGQWERGSSELATASGQSIRAKLAYNRGLAQLRQPTADGTSQQAEALFGEAARLDPREPTYRFARGDGLMARGKFDEAFRTYRQAHDDRAAPTLLVRMGHALLALKRAEEARESFQAYLTSGDRTLNTSAHFGLGQAWYQLGDFRRAVLEFRKASLLDPTSVAARTGLGHALCSQLDYRGALAEYDQALQLQPDDPHAHLGRAVVQYRLNRYPEALIDFGYARELLDSTNREHVDFFISRGYARLKTNQVQTAEQDFSTARRLAPKSAVALAGLSDVYLKKNAFRAARHHLDLALERDPKNAQLLVNRGNLHLHFDDYLPAARDFRQALGYDDRNLNAHNGLGVALIEMDQLEEALARYDSLIGRGHHRSVLYNSRGIVHSYLGLKHDKLNEFHAGRQSYARSLKDFEKAQKIDSLRRFYQNNLGNVYKNIERYDDAVRSYQGYLSKTAINNMGVLLASNDKYAASQHYLNVAIKLDSTSFVFLYNRSKLYREAFKDSVDAARRDLRRGELLLPSNTIAAKYSKDGYLTIYTFDYQYEELKFPGEHRFPTLPAPLHPTEFLAEYDFLEMPETPVAAHPRSRSKTPTGKRLKNPAREPNRRGSTRCPVF